MIVESYEDVIILSGALRHNAWETIHTAISLTLKRHPTGVIVDCSAITECTPEGAETFRDAMDFIDQHDARILVAAVPEHVLEVLKSVPEVRSQLAIAPSVEAARQSLDVLGVQVAKPKVEIQEKVIVVLTGDPADEAALRHASMIADTVRVEVDLVVPLIVPRDLPLQAALPDDEAEAAAAIEKGKDFLRRLNLPHRAWIERGRDVASTVAAVLEETPALHVIVPLPPCDDRVDDAAKLVKSVLGKVKAPTIFVR